MTKINEKSYQAIKKMKIFLQGACDMLPELLDQSSIDVEDLVDNCVEIRGMMSRREQIALVTVLSLGSFYQGSFMMPATSDCCEAFKAVEKRMKKHVPIYCWRDPGYNQRHYAYKICGKGPDYKFGYDPMADVAEEEESWVS